VIAALVALTLAGALTPREPPPLEVLEAGEAEYDVAHERGRASGGVVLRRGLVILRAREATYDRSTGVVDASGGALLLEPGRAVAASAMHAVLDGPFEAHDVVAFLKEAPLDLSRCRSVDDVRAAGRGRVEVGGALAHGESGAPGSRFEVERARITLCDCGTGAPSWEIRARHADVVPGKRAFLTLPIIYITPRFLFVKRPVPVMVLPVLYLPLSDRQSGLLMPAIDLGGISGFSISEPLFLALGRSWDATITPSYAFGPGASTVAAQGHGMKGPELELELRWAPAEGAHGALRVFERHSLIQQWDGIRLGYPRPDGMNRVAISFNHEQRLSDAAYVKAEAALVGDPLYVSDFSGDALLRATDYRRSAVAAEVRRDDVLLEADAAYHLPLTFLNSFRIPAAPFGLFGGGLDTFHRLPSASATLLPIALGGPLMLTATAGVARFAPLRGPTGDEGLDQIGPGERGWGTAVGDTGENDGHWQRGERLAATRAATRVELRAPFTVGRAFLLEPWAAGTAAGYAFEAGQGTQADARAAGGVTASTSLVRAFGQGAARVTHIVEPSLTLRAGTAQAGPALPAFAYDELDFALAPPLPGATGVSPQRTLTAAPSAFQQARLAVRNRLVWPGRLAAELTAGVDADVGRGRLSETWAQGSLQYGPLAANAAARFYAFGAAAPEGTPVLVAPARSGLDRFSELRAALSLADRRGDNVHAGLIAIGNGGSPRLLAGIEPLFDPRPAAVPPTAQGAVGVVARLSGATAVYDALFTARPLYDTKGSPAPLCAGKSTAPHIFQHQATVVWDSPCRCWKAAVAAVLSECDPAPRFHFVIDLSSLAQRSTGF
jgi:LPS-assembly protein